MVKVIKGIFSSFKKSGKKELLICGDFNIAPTDLDIYQPKKDNHIMASSLERQALNEILTIELQDIFRKFNPEGNYFTWWDYRQNSFIKNQGWRIDHIYLTSNLYQKAINSYIDIEPRKLIQPSDHAPVIVEL
jgi:exodeoxyribonuclease-3